MPVIDLGDFSEKLPPEGYFRLEIKENGKYKPNNAKDGHNILVKCQIIDSWDPEFENFDLPIQYLSTKVAARWKLKEALEAITQKDWNEDNAQISVDEDDFVDEPAFENVTIIALIVQGTDQNNRPQCQIKTWMPDNGEIELGASGSD